MIKEFDVSELLSVLLIHRSNGLINGKRQLSYNRFFKISHRITNNNYDFRIRGNTDDVKACCKYWGIKYDNTMIFIEPMGKNKIERLKQYCPLDAHVINEFIKWNY